MKEHVLSVFAALGILACTPNAEMRPGDDCLRCHGGHPGGPETGPVEHADTFSVAGTVYGTPDADAKAGVEGAVVQITDANGSSFELRSNSVGNFYSAEQVAFPVQVCVTRDGASNCMTPPAPNGGCNYCHTVPPNGNAAGRIGAP